MTVKSFRRNSINSLIDNSFHLYNFEIMLVSVEFFVLLCSLLNPNKSQEGGREGVG